MLEALRGVLRTQEQCVEQFAELVHGDRDQPVGGGSGRSFGSGDDGEEGVRKHGQGDPAVP